MKLLIVEDDIRIRTELQRVLAQWQFEVVGVENFQDVMTVFNHESPQLVIMDVNLPHYNGYHWCSEIRKVSQVPILFLSSASDRMDMIMALQMGADDYVAKPIDVQFLITKIQALLRRSYDYVDRSIELGFNDVSLDSAKSTLTHQQGVVQLTYTELQILLPLFQAQGAIVSRDTILDNCWQNNQFIDDNTLAVNISRIRKKLKEIGLNNFISTKKNQGYQLKMSEG